MKMSRCTVLSLLFSIMCVLTSGIVVNQPGSSLDAVQDQLQQALVRELAKGTKGKNDEQSNTTVTMDATHNMKVTAVANITTQSETHVVVTHGTPAVRCVEERETSRAFSSFSRLLSLLSTNPSVPETLRIVPRQM